MKIFYSIVFSVAVIVIFTLGFKYSNAWFRQNHPMGDINYLTPNTEEAQDTAARYDSLKKTEPAPKLDAYTESELVKVENEKK